MARSTTGRPFAVAAPPREGGLADVFAAPLPWRFWAIDAISLAVTLCAAAALGAAMVLSAAAPPGAAGLAHRDEPGALFAAFGAGALVSVAAAASIARRLLRAKLGWPLAPTALMWLRAPAAILASFALGGLRAHALLALVPLLLMAYEAPWWVLTARLFRRLARIARAAPDEPVAGLSGDGIVCVQGRVVARRAPLAMLSDRWVYLRRRSLRPGTVRYYYQPTSLARSSRPKHLVDVKSVAFDLTGDGERVRVEADEARIAADVREEIRQTKDEEALQVAGVRDGDEVRVLGELVAGESGAYRGSARSIVPVLGEALFILPEGPAPLVRRLESAARVELVAASALAISVLIYLACAFSLPGR